MAEELLNFSHYMKLLVGLFAMVDPIAASTSFIAIASGYTAREQSAIAGLAALVMLIVFLLFLIFGTAILDFFAISQGAFMTMGGVVLFFMGLDMIRAVPTEGAETAAPKASWRSVAVVPLAVPLLAGPGAISTVVIFANQEEGFAHQMVVAVVIFLVVAVSYLLLRSARHIARLLGPTGIDVFNKIMGMIVLAIAIEFLFDGMASHFPILATSHS